MLIRKCPIATALALLFASAASASDTTTTLPPLQVAATRTMTPVEAAPGQVEIVTKDEMDGRRTDRLSDIVKFAPGLMVQPGRGLLQSTQTMSLRGIPDERRMLVMLDGIPLNDGFAGSVTLPGIGTENLAQAELLVGPMSSLFGGTAMSGVMNFTTLMPTSPTFNAIVGYGNPFSTNKAPEETRKISLSGGTRFANGLSVLAGANWMATDGYSNEWITRDTKPTGSGWQASTSNKGVRNYVVGNKGQTNWEENGEFLRLEQALGGQNKLRASFMHQAYEYSNTDPISDLRNASGQTVPLSTLCTGTVVCYAAPGGYERNIYSVGGDWELASGLLRLNVSRIDIQRNYSVTQSTSRMSDSPTQSDLVDAYWSRRFGAHGITLGGAWRHDTGENNEYKLSNWTNIDTKTSLYATAGGETDTLGFYIQDEWSISSRLLAHLGLRYDHWENSNGHIRTPGWTSNQIFRDYAPRKADAWSPKLAMRYELSPAIALRASYGKAFRAPSVFELYRTGRIGNTTIAANPELRPETITTTDLGADLNPWQGGEIKLTLFHNKMEDLIYLQGSGSTRNRINAEEAVSYGSTAKFTQRLSSATTAYASFTLTNSEMQKNSQSTSSEGKRLTYLPRKLASLGVDSKWGLWRLNANVRYASKQYSTDDNTDTANSVFGAYDAYTLVDTRIAYQIDRHLTVSLAIDNLLDKQHFSYYEAPRRNWFASVAYNY